MRAKDNSDLIGYGIVAVIAAVLIYNFWHLLVGALAVFGVIFIVHQVNQNNRKS